MNLLLASLHRLLNRTFPLSVAVMVVQHFQCDCKVPLPIDFDASCVEQISRNALHAAGSRNDVLVAAVVGSIDKLLFSEQLGTVWAAIFRKLYDPHRPRLAIGMNVLTVHHEVLDRVTLDRILKLDAVVDESLVHALFELIEAFFPLRVGIFEHALLEPFFRDVDPQRTAETELVVSPLESRIVHFLVIYDAVVLEQALYGAVGIVSGLLVLRAHKLTSASHVIIE